MKHTPGPWTARNDGNYFSIFSSDKRKPSIAHTKGGYTIDPSEIEANASLIASAPEMLDALEKLLPKLSQLQDESAFTWPEKIEALIAKAKGQ